MLFGGSDSEGLLKLWVVSTKSCVKTVAAHEGKVWALAADPTEKFFFSGATDSTVILWKVRCFLFIAHVIL